MSPEFTPVASTAGGVLLGLGASLLLLGEGRVAGVSGILGGLLSPQRGDVGWRAAFLAGMVGAGVVAFAVSPASFAIGIERSPAAMAIAGLLVGFGTRLGNGCTSGHGVCGLSRLSVRSLASVATFMLVGGVVAFVVNHVLGGAA
ncbi:MAG: YeeE/YedE family protein [Myxococcota bacterium]